MEPLQLIEAREIRPRCGGDWQRRCDDVLALLRAYLTSEVLPFSDVLFLPALGALHREVSKTMLYATILLCKELFASP